jgi:hypothetical protein
MSRSASRVAIAAPWWNHSGEWGEVMKTDDAPLSTRFPTLIRRHLASELRNDERKKRIDRERVKKGKERDVLKEKQKS